MKCYYTYDEKTGEKVLIPQCWGTVHSNDIRDCYCKPTFAQFERERYNTILNEKNAEIEALQKEINRLNSRVEFWHKKAKQFIYENKELKSKNG